MSKIILPATIMVLNADIDIELEIYYDLTEYGITINKTLFEGDEVVLDTLSLVKLESELESKFDNFKGDI